MKIILPIVQTNVCHLFTLIHSHFQWVLKMISFECLPSRVMHCCSCNESFPMVLLQCEWHPSMPRKISDFRCPKERNVLMYKEIGLVKELARECHPVMKRDDTAWKLLSWNFRRNSCHMSSSSILKPQGSISMIIDPVTSSGTS